MLNQYPSIEDIEEIDALSEDEIDLGWAYDTTWTARRIILVTIILITVLAFLLLSFWGLFFPTPNPAPPTPMLPMV
jgi:hypothetical protein